MVRSADSPYKTSLEREQRSANLLKLKPVFDDEFKIVGYKEGKGKDAGAITWELETKDKIKFSATPNMPLNERKKLFKKVAKNEDKYIGKMMTVEYRGLSNDDVPLQPKAITTRDYE